MNVDNVKNLPLGKFIAMNRLSGRTPEARLF